MTRRTLALVLALVLLHAPRALAAQTCDPTACAPAVNAAADALCYRARSAELRVGEYRQAAEAAEAREHVCIGRMQQLIATPPDPPTAPVSPLWLRLTLDVATPALAGTGAALVALDAPAAYSTGVLVAAAAALLSRVAVELLDQK